MATPMQVRRRGRFALITAVLVGALALVATAFGDVSATPYYAPVGTTVQIAGDGMNANENVTVDVLYPDVSLAQEHVVAADASGNFTDSYTVQATDPAGVYTVNATGQNSSNAYTTTFDPPPPPTTTTLTVTPGTSTGNAGEVYYGDTLTFAGTVASASTVTSGSIVVKQSKERKSNLCATADFSGNKIDIYNQSITNGAYSSGAFTPVLSAFPTNSIASGNYAIANALNPPLVPNPVAYVSSVGTYAFESSFSDTGGGHFGPSDSSCGQVNVVQAPTTTTSKPADASGNLLTQVGVGVPFFVEWGVGSSYGVTSNTAAGTVTLTQSDAGLGCPSGAGNAKSFTAGETTGSGFSYAANSGTNAGSRFSCTATTPNTYTVYVTFADNPDTAATNPDGNYLGSQSSPSSVTVTAVQVQACMAAPAIAAAYLKANNIKINSPKYNNIVQQIANEMASLTRAQFPTYAYTKGSKVPPTAGALLGPCDTGYQSSVQAKTQYYIDTTR
jgi:hypothetical protein